MASAINDISAITPTTDPAKSVSSSVPDLAKVGDNGKLIMSSFSEVLESDSVNRSGDLNNIPVHSVIGEETNDSKNKILPRRLSITYPNPDVSLPDVETEVCHVSNSDCAQVSVIKAELNIGSDGAEEESYLLEDQTNSVVAGKTTASNDTRTTEVMDQNSQAVLPIVPSESSSKTNLFAINPKHSANSSKPIITKRSPRGRKPANVGSKLNKVVSKLILAKSNKTENETNPSILHNLLRNSPLNEFESADNQCLQTTSFTVKCTKKTATKLLPPAVPESLRLPSELVIIPGPAPMTYDQKCARDTPVNICDNLPKIPHCTIPSPVVNRLRKLGTVVEVESNSSVKPDIASRFTKLFDSMAQADNILSDLTKKKKKKTTKKDNDHKVPSDVLMENAAEEKFYFQVDKSQVMELAEGQKLFTCDICSGVYYRGFSLKRHYLKTHINSKHVSARDLHNCGIVVDKTAIKNGAKSRPKVDSPPIVTNLAQPKNILDLYRCHNCYICFPDKSELKVHLMDHPPVSLETINEKQFAKTYRCAACLLHFQKKKQYIRHLESCGQEQQNLSYHCLYCEKSFSSFEFKKKHQWKMHHPKKRLHPCYICKMKMFKDLSGLFKHLLSFHREEYFGCLVCKMKFADKTEWKKHKKETHVKEKKQELQDKTSKAEEKESETLNTENASNEESHFKCSYCLKTFNEHVKLTKHQRLAHNVSKKNKKDAKTEPSNEKGGEPLSSNVTPSATPQPVVDPETFFYSRISMNIRENLLHHLDGKLDSQEVMEYDLKQNSLIQVNRNKVLNFSASFTSKTSLEKQSSVMPLKDDVRPNNSIISPKVPWEKFSFPKNYDGRCGLTSYIKDMSHLDIATQLTMRRNLQRFNCSLGQESNKDVVSEDIPSGLSLERQGAACAETYGDPEANSAKSMEGMLELSGEWVRPRTYICAACGLKSGSLWEIEDHKAALHPNVWCPHIEVVGDQSCLWDWVYCRSLPSDNAGYTLLQVSINKDSNLPKCTKCLFQSSSTPDMHRHLLECGGDSTWMATMLAITSPGSRRSKKWRPFGSRRRRQQGRRGMKRNIPNTPAKHVCGKIRTKPGDTDTIQKMIANLPPKRVTRKVIEELDIKTRSQATINSVPINVFTYTNKPPSSLNNKTSKPGKHSSPHKTPSGTGKKSKSIETVENKKEDSSNAKKSIKTESSGSSFTDEDPGQDPSKLEDILVPQNIETEDTVQHSDILTSLQMIPVIRKEVSDDAKDSDNIKEPEGPIATETVLAAMREAMDAAADVPAEKVFKKKPKEKKKNDNISVDVIICNGCGMQFDHSSACLRHKKKCVYWKQEKTADQSSTNKCTHCNTVFPYLMALLTHNCKIAKINDEPSMPELSREEPIEEIKTEGVEDIPILSPEDMKGISMIPKHDEGKHSMSLILLETTIDEVANESFIIEEFHLKSKICFARPGEIDFDKIETEQLMGVEERERNEINTSENQNSFPDKIDSNEPPNKKLKLNNSPKKKNAFRQLSPKQDIKQAEKNDVKPNNELLDEVESNSDNRIKRSMDNFKTKQNKTKRKLLLRASIPNKGIKKNLNVLKRKMKAIRKKRSTNLDMLLKESEKLGEDGALILGKRTRHNFVNRTTNNIHKTNIEVKDETKEIIKKKPGRPKKVKYVILPEMKSESGENTSTLNAQENSELEHKNTLENATKMKPKFKLSTIDRKTGKLVKYNFLKVSNNENNTKEIRLRQTNLDEVFQNIPTNETVIIEKRNTEIVKKQKVKPKMKQTTLNLIRSPENKTENKLPNAVVKDNLQVETCSQEETSRESLKIDAKIKSKQKTSNIHDTTSTKLNKDKKQNNENCIEDPDEIPLSRIIMEPKEYTEGSDKLSEMGKKDSNIEENENILINIPTKRQTRNSPVKNDLKPKQDDILEKATKVDIEVNKNNSKNLGKEITEDNIKSNESSKQKELDNNITTKESIKASKEKNYNEATVMHSEEQSKKISDDMEWDTINKVIATYCLEESTELLVQKKKQRGRPALNSVIKNEEAALEMNSSNVKQKASNLNQDKNSNKPVKTNKKKISTPESQQETIEMVVNAANFVHVNCDVETDQTDSLIGISEESISNCLIVEETKGSLVATDVSLANKESKAENIEDPDEDESLISLKKKLQIEKEKKLKEDSIKRKLFTDNVEVSVENVSQDSNGCTTNLDKDKSNPKTKKKFKKGDHLKKKCLKVSKSSKNFEKLDSSASLSRSSKGKLKKKKKIKLKKILKSVNFGVTEVTVKKVTKRNMSSEQIVRKSSKLSDKILKNLKKKHKFGVAGNKWQVSVVDFAADSIKPEASNTTKSEEEDGLVNADTQYYCATCDEHFMTPFALYEHQLTVSHKNKQATEQPKEIELCCNKLANVLNDLGKKTLQVAKVMNKLQQKESTDSMQDDLEGIGVSNITDVTNLSVAQTNIVLKKEQPEPGSVEAWTSQTSQNQDWVSQDWSMIRPTTPLWDNQQQPWENESNFSSGCGSSLGSIFDTVNKILAEQDVSAQPPGLPQYTMADLQKAMGASDEEMAMLEQLGEGSLQEDYVYDNSRPGADIWPKEDVPTFMDLDNQEPGTVTAANSQQDAIVPVETQSVATINENENEMRQCRGLLGRPRRHLSGYEMREMVCPTCNKHFLGLSALQTHVAWSHCAPVQNSARFGGGLKRRALLNGCDEIDRRLVCFVCKEIVSSSNQLDVHIQAQHMKKNCDEDKGSSNKEEGAEKLKSKMSNALGGLLDRALNNLLGSKQKTSETIDPQPELNSGALQLLGKLCAVRRRVGNENMKLSGDTLQLLGRLRAAKRKEEANSMKLHPSFAKELRQVINRTVSNHNKASGVNKANLSASVISENSSNPDAQPTNLLDHLAVCSNDVDQKPYACPICDTRFLIPSVRNRHIARAHGKYGKKYDEEVQEQIAEQLALEAGSDSSDDIGDNDWRDEFFPSLDDQNCEGEIEINPLCSDCGLSFRSIHDVIRHRKEDHPRRFSADTFLEEKTVSKEELCKIKTKIDDVPQLLNNALPVEEAPINILPISDSAIDSTSSLKKRRGRSSKIETVTQNPSTEKEQAEKKCPNRKILKKRKNTEEDDYIEELLGEKATDVKEESEAISKIIVEDKQDETISNGYEEFNQFLGKIDAECNFNDKKREESQAVPKKMDKRKGRLSFMGEESVRVKAEAALKELNQPRKNKALVANARWGVNSLRFVKSTEPNTQNNNQTPCFSTSKVRFASLSDKKYKGSSSEEGTPVKSEKSDSVLGLDDKPDIYDFNDDDILLEKKPFSPLKDLQDIEKTKLAIPDEGNNVR